MKYNFLLLLFLSACVSRISKEYSYLYIISNNLDNEINKQSNTCIIIDNSKTSLKKGHKEFSSSPFVGNNGFSATNINKVSSIYGYEFDNIDCENPISISRNIQVSSISFPGICYRQEYAGSINLNSYTNTNYTYNSWNNSASSSSITNYNTMPLFNSIPYECIKEKHLIEINFYKNSIYLGTIKSKFWEEINIDETIQLLTTTFIDKLEKEN